MANASLNIERERRNWKWFLFWGILLIVLGIAAMIFAYPATLVTVLALGWLMFASGIVEGIQAFHARGWSHVLLHVAGAALGILIGLLVTTHPIAGALAWTLLFATFLTVIGLFRIIAAVSLRYRSWGWTVLDGIIALALGTMLWIGLPWTGLWFMGIALGISLILRGWSTVMFAFAIRTLGEVIPIRSAA
jgi:uncharacterized membrane protein HdeD (DUF308 family)